MTEEQIQETRNALENEEIENNDTPVTQEVEEVQTEQGTPDVEAPTPAPAQTPVEQPVKTYSQSEFDQMVHSFKRQIAKNNDKWNKRFADYDKEFGSFKEQFSKWANPEKELNPEDFATYGEYAKAVVEKEVERRWADKEKSMREEYENYQKQYEQDMKHRSELDKGINKWYPDEASRTAWHDTVSKAYEDGLEDLLNQEKNIVEYLHQTPNYPLILEHFATHKDQVEQICMLGSPLMRILAVHDLENKLVAERSAKNVATAPAPTNVTPTQAPVETPKPVNNLARAVGKPGNGTEAEPDIFGGDHSALRDALRAM